MGQSWSQLEKLQEAYKEYPTATIGYFCFILYLAFRARFIFYAILFGPIRYILHVRPFRNKRETRAGHLEEEKLQDAISTLRRPTVQKDTDLELLLSLEDTPIDTRTADALQTLELVKALVCDASRILKHPDEDPLRCYGEWLQNVIVNNLILNRDLARQEEDFEIWEKECELKQYNFSLTRKFTRFGRWIHVSKPWRCPRTSSEDRIMVLRKGLSVFRSAKRMKATRHIALDTCINSRELVPKRGMHVRFSRYIIKSRTPTWKELKADTKPVPTPTIVRKVPAAARPPLYNPFLTTINPGTGNVPESLASFESFPRLPTELRLMIWRFARPGPQIHRLKQKTAVVQQDDCDPAVYSTASIPAIVHACNESREYALRHWYHLRTFYQKRFSTDIYGLSYYFDPENDYMYLGCEKCKEIYCSECHRFIAWDISKKVQNIIFNWEERTDPMFCLILSYPNAKNIKIVSPKCSTFKDGIELGDLQECSDNFSWQAGNSLMEMHIAEVVRTTARGEREYLEDLEEAEKNPTYLPSYDSNPPEMWFPKPRPPPTIADSIICVELRVKKPTPKKPTPLKIMILIIFLFFVDLWLIWVKWNGEDMKQVR